MRSVLCAAVIIAGIVLFSFLRDDSGTISATARRGTPVTIIDARASQKDMYGNEVSPAVADYLIDPYGILYERHAPDTAILDIRELPEPGT